MGSDDNFLVRLTNAGLARNGRWLVRGVDLQLARGEIVSLIGPNGSGKSTTAKLALGILKPDEGTVEQGRGLRVGYVPQKLQLDWALPLTVERMMRLTHSLGDSDIDQALATTKCGHLRMSQVSTLSGGEFQRVMLARAIARKPDLLVLDEPVQGVDFAGEIELYELIEAERDRLGCGVLMVSHDLHVVMASTDRVLCLNGHVCCSGTPSSVANDAAYKALFGARASEAVAVYRHAHDHTHLPDGRVQHADGSITEHCHPDGGHHHEDEKLNAADGATEHELNKSQDNPQGRDKAREMHDA